MHIFIVLNFILTVVALWYRHTDKADKQLKDDLGTLMYAAPTEPGGTWLCRSPLHPVLTGEGITSVAARNDLIKKYKQYLRNLKHYGKR